jgi:hypothetical protein
VIARLVASRSAIEGEDFLLAGWNLVAIPVGTAVAGSWSSGAGTPLLGLIEVAAVLLAIVALATRPSGSGAPPNGFRTWILSGPLIGALALVGQEGAQRLGLPGTDVVLAIALLVGIGAIVLVDHLPVIEAGRRRLLVVPLILIAAGIFQEIGTDIVGAFDVGGFVAGWGSVAGSPAQALTIGLIVLSAAVLGSGTFFAMLVIAPRELADPEPRPSVWLARFVLFLVSAATGIGIWAVF